MKFLFGLLLTLFVFSVPTPIQAQREPWTITSFDSDISIRPSGNVEIEELITVEFDERRRGIIRSLPYLYRDSGEEYYTEVSILEVERNDRAEPFQTTNSDGYVNIRIGEESTYLTGKQEYRIRYSVAGILESFDTYDELYWNATGNGWGVPIENAQATVSLPEDGLVQIACYQGPQGSSDPCQTTQTSSAKVTFQASRPLEAGEGLTVAVGYEPEMVPLLRPERPPTEGELLMQQLTTPWGTAGVIIAILGGIGLPWWLWYRNGRDWWWQQPGILEENQTAWLKPWRHKPQVVVEFTPPLKLPPAVVGKLIDQKADTLDITATIVDLATRGYVTITEIDKKWLLGSKDYQLIRTELPHNDLLEYEKLLLEKLFKRKTEIKVSELKNTFYQDLEKVKESLREEVMHQGYFVKNPKTVRTIYMVVGFITLAAGFSLALFGGIMAQLWLVLIGGFGIIAGIGITLLSGSMPQRTAKGFEAYRRILGYELFISTAETHKQQFLENKNIFTQILPYAMVFGLTDKLAKAMEKIGVEPPQPTWYHGAHGFNAAMFSHNMTAMSTAMSQQMTSTPSSSGSGGGGFSGGGFGGGGGGSW